MHRNLALSRVVAAKPHRGACSCGESRPSVSDKKKPPDQRAIAAAIRRLLRERGAGKSICPSEVARALAPTGFRALLDAVRAVAARMVGAREIVVTQRGVVVDAVVARGPVRLASASITKSAYVDAYRDIDFRAHPEMYRVGRGEAGVLVAEPYKSELLPHWRFRTKAIAEASAAQLWKAFVRYRRAGDFVGMDMARKFLQMGFTRARRYANHRSGKIYAARDVGRPRAERSRLPRVEDEEKAAAAAVFYETWQRAEHDPTYAAWRRQRAELRK